jgi:hypothetical protein
MLCEKDAGSFIFYNVVNPNPELLYIVDGQHRVEAIRKFIDDELPVTHKGQTYLFSDFTEIEKRHFRGNIMGNFKIVEDATYNKETVEAIYNTFNYSGVAHNV